MAHSETASDEQQIWRIERRWYLSSAFKDQCSLKTGGRWHRRGTQVAYASEHPAVAALDKLAWLGSYEAARKSEYVLVPLIANPQQHVEVWPDDQLPGTDDQLSGN